MKYLRSLLLFSTLVSSIFAATIPDCAVLDLEGVNVDSSTTLVLSEKLRREVFRTEAVRLVERSRMDVILQEQGFQQTGCTSSECQVETGRLLGVSQLIAGSVSKMGASGTWHLSLTLIDVETGAILRMADWTHSGAIEEVMENGIAETVQKLLGTTPIHSASQPVAQALAPTTKLSTGFTPFALSLISPIQFPSSAVPVWGIAIDGLYGKYTNIWGLQAGLVGRTQDQYGLSVTAVSIVEGRMGGMQVGAFYSLSKEIYGMQIGLVNQADRVIGMQIGLVNSCKRLTGVQIGLWNSVTGREFLGSMPILNIGF